MRISKNEHQFIKTYWQGQLPNSRVYLFGSRVDDHKRGGDIDLLILDTKKITLTDKIKFLSCFMDLYGEQKVDLVSYTFDEEQPFKKIALCDAVEL